MFFMINTKKKELENLNLRIAKAQVTLEMLNKTNVSKASEILQKTPPCMNWDEIRPLFIRRDSKYREFTTEITYIDQNGVESTVKFFTSDENHEKIINDFLAWKGKKIV